MSVRISDGATPACVSIEYRGYDISITTWGSTPELMIFNAGGNISVDDFQSRMASMESIIEAKEHIDNMIDTKTKLIWATNHRFARR